MYAPIMLWLLIISTIIGTESDVQMTNAFNRHAMHTTQAATSPKPPHLVVVLTDDLGYNAPGYNNPDLVTPTLDALAANGLKLTKHYVFRYCSPTRAAFLTGRGPMSLANVRENFIPTTIPQGTDLGFTMLPKRLKEAGYVSHQVGKWHQGFHKAEYLPRGRGFDTSYGFLAGGEDHFSQTNTNCDWGKVTDYYHTDAPASDCNVDLSDRLVCPQWEVETHTTNATHADALCGDTLAQMLLSDAETSSTIPEDISHIMHSSSYKNCAWDGSAPAHQRCFQCKPPRYTGFDLPNHAVQLIQNHNPKIPLFLYLALHNTHAPVEAPPEFSGLYHFSLEKQNVFDGMISVVDSAVENVTSALKENENMWNNTLFIWTTDNGSPVKVAGSNAPLKDSKGSVFEGGVRTPAFINGGFLPDHMRGHSLNDMVAIWDYYGTFLSLAGVTNPLGDSNPHSPAPPDTYNQWPYWSGLTEKSPRTTIVLDHLRYNKTTTACLYAGITQSMPCNESGSLIQGDLKLLVGEIGFADWYGHFTPNSSWTQNMSHITQCSVNKPCLFNITADKEEAYDLSAQQPATVAQLLQAFHSYDSHWHPPSDPPPDDVDAFCKVALSNGGFAVPWRDGDDSVV